MGKLQDDLSNQALSADELRAISEFGQRCEFANREPLFSSGERPADFFLEPSPSPASMKFLEPTHDGEIASCFTA